MDDHNWRCAFCIFVNKPDSEICWACRQAKRPSETAKGWHCTRCTLLNEPHLNSCLLCGAENVDSDFDSIGETEQYIVDRIDAQRCPLPTSYNKAPKYSYVAPLAFVENTGDDLIENVERFECPLCYLGCHQGDGVVLKNCNHRFCKECLIEVVEYSSEIVIKCPFKNRGHVCPCLLSDGEVNALLNHKLGTNVSLNSQKTANGYVDSAIPGYLYDNSPANRNPVQLSYRLNNIHFAERQNFNVTAMERNLPDNVNHPYFVDQSTQNTRLLQVRHEPMRVLDYQELVELENKVLISNIESFECSICFVECGEGEGIVIRDCLHTFCRPCMKQAIQFNTDAEMRCPYGDGNNHCDSLLQDREIRALDPEGYEKHLTRSITEAENKITNTFHCKTADCKGWCIYEEEVTEFYCPVCSKTNCINCKVIHTGLNCKQYQEKIKREIECNADNAKSETYLEELVKKGEAMPCPHCKIIVTKIVGCDWLRCLMCKTEICWVTRGPRWGPGGSGDTSGGCRCRVNGSWCHPQCGNCH